MFTFFVLDGQISRLYCHITREIIIRLLNLQKRKDKNIVSLNCSKRTIQRTQYKAGSQIESLHFFVLCQRS